MPEPVLLESHADGVTTLTLNRPARRNALSPDLIEALIGAFTRLRDDPAVQVLVLTGAGDKAFCAGGDLGAPPAGGFQGLHQQRGRFIDLIEAMIAVGRPTVARVNGACLGGGLGLMLACDLAVASREATFGTPELRVGLFPMMIMALIFRNIGRKRGMEMILTGERLDADEADRIGLVNRAVDAAELDAAVAALVGRVTAFSPAVLRLGRQAVYASMDMGLGEALRFLHGQLSVNTMLEDAGEGVAAFLQKRDPAWKGR